MGLEFVTTLGGGGDPRAAEAIRLLKKKRLRDGRWSMDAIQVDFLNRGRVPRRPQEFVRAGVKPRKFEQAGKPCKMITLRALRVLKRLGEPMPD